MPRIGDSRVKEDMMDIICCPLDKAELELDVEDSEGDDVLEGTLTCTECGEVYPINEGIPNLLPPDMREGAAA